MIKKEALCTYFSIQNKFNYKKVHFIIFVSCLSFVLLIGYQFRKKDVLFADKLEQDMSLNKAKRIVISIEISMYLCIIF